MSEPQSTTILLSLIDPSPLNPRKTFDEAALAELAETLKTQGMFFFFKQKTAYEITR